MKKRYSRYLHPLRDICPDITNINKLIKEGYGVTIIGKDVQRFLTNTVGYRMKSGYQTSLKLFLILTGPFGQVPVASDPQGAWQIVKESTLNFQV
jgi:hypothetical protein